LALAWLAFLVLGHSRRLFCRLSFVFALALLVFPLLAVRLALTRLFAVLYAPHAFRCFPLPRSALSGGPSLRDLLLLSVVCLVVAALWFPSRPPLVPSVYCLPLALRVRSVGLGLGHGLPSRSLLAVVFSRSCSRRSVFGLAGVLWCWVLTGFPFPPLLFSRLCSSFFWGGVFWLAPFFLEKRRLRHRINFGLIKM